MGDSDERGDPPQADRLHELLLPAMRELLERSGVEGSGAYNYYDTRVRQGLVFLEYEIALARKLLSCGLGIRRVDEVGSGFGQLMFLLGWNGFKTIGFEINPLRGDTAATLHGMLQRAEPALTGNVRLIQAEFPVRFGPWPRAGSMVLTTNLVATCSRAKQLAVLRAMRRYPFVLSDVQRFFDYRPERHQESEALALFAEAGLRDPELFLDLGAGGRYYLFANPVRRGFGLLSALWR
ncbi:MAG: hypothetical protein K2X72_20070 [Reyranella sp.]|nr:hypothetical protein [Reyranella sp.]